MPIETNATASLKLPKYALHNAILSACKDFKEDTGLSIFKYNINVSLDDNKIEELEIVEIKAGVKI